MLTIYNLNEYKTPAGQGAHLAALCPHRKYAYHRGNYDKLIAVVPRTRTEAKHMEGQIWTCKSKIQHWARRAKVEVDIPL